jgi:hypothetical protein
MFNPKRLHPELGVMKITLQAWLLGSTGIVIAITNNGDFTHGAGPASEWTMS